MLTQEQKQAIYEKYIDRRNTVNEISKEFGIMRGQVAHIAVEMGAEPRKNSYGTKYKIGKRAARICPQCHNPVDVKGAKFCCFCGSDIRSEKELLIERVDKAFRVIQFLPSTARDEMQQLFLDITAALNKD